VNQKDTAISLHVNGSPREVPSGLTLASLLRHLGRDPQVPGIAVALAGRVVPRARWEETDVHDGADVEIVTAIQGG
jgi:sulfur carrier protein